MSSTEKNPGGSDKWIPDRLVSASAARKRLVRYLEGDWLPYEIVKIQRFQVKDPANSTEPNGWAMWHA